MHVSAKSEPKAKI